MRWYIGALCGLSMALARPVVAQQPNDSLAFRRGQWGAEFTVGTEARSLGVLRFLSPQRALVLDGGGAFENATSDGPDDSSRRELQARLGMRWFRRVAPGVRQYVTAGVTGGLRRERREQSATGPIPPFAQTLRSNYAGVFANIGAMWQPNAHLAFGANWEASYLHSSTRQEYAPVDPQLPANRRFTGNGVSIASPRLVMSLLF